MDTQDFRKPTRRMHGILMLVVLVVALVGYALSDVYHEWMLSGATIDIVVYCHSEPLQTEKLRAVVFYDRLALNPVAVVFGLYQDRPPEAVQTYLARRVPPERIGFTPTSVRLDDVPYGPVARLYFNAGEKRFYIDVEDRSVQDGVLHVHAR